MRIFFRVVAFLGLFIVGYVVSVGGATFIEWRDRPIVERLIGRSLEPGGYGQTLRRFREAGASGEVDILFAGSSHAVRGFDVRPYEAAGLRAMNVGSMAQTPLNSYYVLDDHLARLQPRLLVYELYPEVIGAEAISSAQDLIVNTPATPWLFRMTMALRSPEVLATLVATFWTRLQTPLDDAISRDIPGETYVEGGYLEKADSLKVYPDDDSPVAWILKERQLTYLRRISHMAKVHDVQLVFVTHPLPTEKLENVTGAEAAFEQLAALAQEEQIPYLNLNGTLRLSTLDHFYDTHHLNAAGGRIFNDYLLQWLQERYPHLTRI